jgi:hypothetical protein
MLENACHGWSVHGCRSALFFLRKGVRIDDAVATWPDGRRVDVAAGIAAELRRGGEEYLHLDFGKLTCSRRGFEASFSGSRIGLGQTGSAAELRGDAIVTHAGPVLVKVGR